MFELPLDPDKFKAALHRGQGRAFMHARRFGLGGLDEVLIDALLHDRQYDPQCECGRFAWLLDLIARDPIGERVLDAVIPRLGEPTENFWDATQRCAVAQLLAARGRADARTALYQCLRICKDSSDVIGPSEIIELDGADGLLRVASFLGALNDTDRERCADNSPIRWYDEAHGEGAARRILEHAAVHSKEVAAYLRAIEPEGTGNEQSEPTRDRGYLNVNNVQFQAQARESHADKMRRISARDVIESVRTESGPWACIWLISWGGYAAVADLRTIRDELSREEDPERIQRYLRPFTHGVLPELDPCFLRLANHEDTRVRDLAQRAASHYAHPDVRKLALDRLSAGQFVHSEVLLLKKNFQAGDAALLMGALRPDVDIHDLHGVGHDLLKVFSTNKTPECLEPMLFLYEHTPCSNCREDAVEIMMSTNTAPAWVLDECRFDCASSLRSRVGGGSPPD